MSDTATELSKKLESHINKIKEKLKNKCNNKDFKDIVDVIYKSKEKVFKITKSRQIKKFNHLQQQPDTETRLFQTASERNG